MVLEYGMRDMADHVRAKFVYFSTQEIQKACSSPLLSKMLFKDIP